ncbi:tape measure protein [Providencia huashanensis]|uniref:tape measure protein n=1 Tax=Providencia huashanensis TaxID=3037798 RepID=UPI002AFF63EC|nr:tape measure protein [Providencia sp. 23021821]
MALNAGSVEFIIKADTEQLLVANKQVDRSLSDLDVSFDKTSKSAEKTEKAMFSFSKAAMAVTSALSAGAVIHAVDEWGQMAARIKMALKSVEGDVNKYSEIQDRFLEISNRNGKAIETVQSLYAGSATSIKELGYGTEQTIDYIESLSSAFTANATGAQQTESAMNALNRAMVVGTLRGNDWHSVLNATPSVVGDIAKELSRLRGGVKVTENDVKKMAMETGISMKLFVDAMRNSKEENNALADSMDNTVADGFTKLTNSAKAYYGELNQSLGLTRSVSAGFAVLTQNFNYVADAIAGIVAISAARYFGNLSNAMFLSSKAALQAAIDNRRLNVEKVNSTQVTLNQIKAEKALAVTTQQSLSAQLAAAKSEAARTAIRRQLATNSATITSLTKAETIATNELAAAQSRLSIASGMASRALGLIGGPMGAAMLAAGAIYYLYQNFEQAKVEAKELSKSLDLVTKELDKMTWAQKEVLAAKLRESLPKLNANLLETNVAGSKARGAVAELSKELSKLEEGTQEYIAVSRRLAEANDKLTIAQDKEREALEDLNRAKSTAERISAELNKEVENSESIFGNATNAADKLGNAVQWMGKKIQEAANAQRNLNDAQSESRSEEGDKYIQQLKDQNELLSIQDKRERAIAAEKQKQLKAGTVDGSTQMKEALALAGKNYDLAESERERGRGAKESSKASDTATNAIKRQIAEIERLNKGYEEGSKKLAQYDAGKALGDKANPQQIAEAERLAGELYDIQQRLADKRAALEADVIAKAEKLKTDELAQIERQLKAGDISFEESQRRRLEIASEYATKIAEATANNIITPGAENRAKFDPVQALQNENTRKLALMREYYTQEQQLLENSYAKQQMSHEQFTAAKQATDMQYRALITAMDNQYQQQQTAAQWELMRNQSLSYEMLASAVDSFAGNASNVMTGLMTGTMSAADAMRSLGNTILNSVVNSIVQVGVEMLKNFIISKTMGVAAQTANAAAAVAGGAAALAAWTPAAIAASIATGGAAAGSGLASFQSSMLAGQSMSLLGGRRYGGNVSGGNPYRINESGESEIFQTYDGKQAFIPNKSGKVIPADKAGGSNLPPIINVYQQASGATVDVTTEKGLNAQDVINIVVRNIIEGREVSGAMSTHHNAPRKATGSL